MPDPCLPLPRPDLDFGQRLLVTGAAPDVLLHAWSQGWVDVSSLNARHKELALVEAWLNHPDGPASESLAGAAMRAGHMPSLEWPVASDPARLPGALLDTWAGKGAWLEFALCKLIEAGLDPLLPFSGKRPSQSRERNLLEWASVNDFPWLLDTCLAVVGPERARELAVSSHGSDGHEATQLPRIHEALAHGRLLTAQVWHRHGADPMGLAPKGRQALSFAKTPAALEWALGMGNALDHVDAAGQVPPDYWRRYASAQDWGQMQELAAATSQCPDLTMKMLQSAISKADLSAVKVMDDEGKSGLALLPNGYTPLGWAACCAISTCFRPSHERSRFCKVLAHLWPRANLESTQANERAGVSDLQLAILASSNLDRISARAMEKIKAQLPEVAGNADLARWLASAPHGGWELEDAARARVSKWMIQRALELFSTGRAESAVAEATAALAALPGGDYLETASAYLATASANAYAATREGALSGACAQEAADFAFMVLDKLSESVRDSDDDVHWPASPSVVPLDGTALAQGARDFPQGQTGPSSKSFQDACFAAYGFIQAGYSPSGSWLASAVRALEACRTNPVALALLPVMTASLLDASWAQEWPQSPSTNLRLRM